MTPPAFELPPPPLAPGTLVDGRWRVRAVLGEGATGVVYDVGDEGADGGSGGDGGAGSGGNGGGDKGARVDVALKLVHAHLAGDPQIRGRLAREVIALRKVSHANVCPVLGWGEMARPEGSPVPYVVLRRIRGPSLEDLLLEKGTLPLARALDVLEEIAEGVAAAHAVGVVHRDLKPSNVMLEGGVHAVVVDFGLSRVLGGGTGTTGLTEHDMLVGTPEYMSPEQARGDEPDARTDVYALGVLAYELAAGCVPFAASSPFIVLTAQLEETPVAPRVRAPARGIGPALEAVVLRALAKSPDDRFASVDAMLEALRAARRDDGGAAARPGVPEAPATVRTRDETRPTSPRTLPLTPSPVGRSPSSRPPERSLTPTGRPASVRPPPATADAPWPRREAAERAGTRRRSIVLWLAVALVSLALGLWLGLADLPLAPHGGSADAAAHDPDR